VPFRVTRVLLGYAIVKGYFNTYHGERLGVFCQFACRQLEMKTVKKLIRQLWTEESGQDVAEYAVMLAVILVIVIGTVRLIGTNANTVFSQVGSQMAQ
jgi:pilus assembly protein Flp/PilA